MKEKLSPFQASILVYLTQSGVTLFYLPRLVAEAFGTNGWIGLFIIYFIVNINLVLIWLVFKLSKGRSMLEIIAIFPKWITFPFNLIIGGLWTLLGVMVMVKFCMILKVLFYNNAPLIYLLLMAYILSYLLLKKDLYQIAKANVVLFYFTVWTVFLLAFHLPEFNFTRLTPFIFKGETDMLQGGLSIFTALLGYELSILYIHRIERKPLLSLLVGNSITSIIYLGVTFVSFGFFSFEQLLREMYPVVTLLGYISFPVLERVENFTFSVFGIKVLMTTVMYLWGTKELLQYQFKRVKPNYLLISILIISFLMSFIPKVIKEVDQWITYISYGCTAVAFLLPIFLLIIVPFTNKKNRKLANE
ncbi:GerAB/ArcD/ProY family transporter [Neobacillus sp. 179-C4.2 HS]|uniref:GerAB/ArcD/ProY family transporter n=1 Tax=Neobacillus driksii TaxID=3035913 RepID=A0ABV4YQF6_9BACI|nr:GerAB/ArcD/ProY family transporter [Neobacillus sp. 179.-C4.2 HS]MDP5196941.1 GerAB/ArcD/ProY family transporter [Neobacillus sp. 179.-C4.2 HS]